MKNSCIVCGEKCRKNYCNNSQCQKARSRLKSNKHRQKLKSYASFGLGSLRECYMCQRLFISIESRKGRDLYCGAGCANYSKIKPILLPSTYLKESDRFIDKNIGYVWVYCPSHPKSNTRGYYYEHRLVAEERLGRYLRNNEVVHHINSLRWDNRPENLLVLDKREHSRLHKQGNAGKVASNLI